MSQTSRTAQCLPVRLSWHDRDNPLPWRVLKQSPIPRTAMDLEAPPWLDTGDISAPFDFCARVQALCADIVERCEELWHIDISRLLFDVTQARTNERHGLQARVTPLRFRDGRTTRRRGGVLYRVQQYVVNDVEMLYLVTFCLPRFLDQSFDEKFITLFHELFHISPSFNGDFRRFPGRCSLHTHNQKQFDARMAKLARVYLATNPDPALYSFLRLNFARLQHRHGSVVGVMLPRPRLIPHQED